MAVPQQVRTPSNFPLTCCSTTEERESALSSWNNEIQTYTNRSLSWNNTQNPLYRELSRKPVHGMEGEEGITRHNETGVAFHECHFPLLAQNRHTKTIFNFPAFLIKRKNNFPRLNFIYGRLKNKINNHNLGLKVNINAGFNSTIICFGKNVNICNKSGKQRN